jgi:hypothetical protein
MKIICIGRNYNAHVKEMNSEMPREPLFFIKPDSALLRNNDPFFIPEWTKEVHHEIELIIRINRRAKNVEKRFAYRYYDKIVCLPGNYQREIRLKHLLLKSKINNCNSCSSQIYMLIHEIFYHRF